MTGIELYPSIDLRGGRVVRLSQGDYGRETDYRRDPVAVATGFADEGAGWIHVVDLDAAKGDPSVNRRVVAAVVGAVAGRSCVQCGGGVRTLDDARRLVDIGAARVVMGSAALADPALVETVTEVCPVAVGLDHRDGELAVHGWTEPAGVRLFEAFDRYPSAAAFVVTNIAVDGTLDGPDAAGLTDAVAATSTPIIASGGVGGLDDIRRLAEIAGLRGIITGRAIYERRLRVGDAVALLAAQR